MLNNRARLIIKVAVLCMAVSLLSFFTGTVVGRKQSYVDINDKEAVAPIVQEQLNFKKLKPISDVIELIESNYVEDVESDILIEGAIRGIIDSLGDPYSSYMDEREFQNLITTIRGTFSGVGMVLSVHEQTGEIIVVSPIEGTPAQKAGILPRDIIVKIDDVDFTKKSLDEAVSTLRGDKGTKVTIHIKRENIDELLKFELVRDDIRSNTVENELMDGSIGYIKITSFDANTYDEFKTALDNLKAQGIKGLILDLRNNPGGSLYESVRIADEILGQGLIVYTEDKNKNKLEEYYSDENKINIPLAVLINENSASASEIVAGAIQDHKSGKLIGTKTFGKGSVQQVTPFEDGTGMKLTIARYHIPSGRCIDGIGIEPDINVQLKEDINPFNIPRDSDYQLFEALKVIKSSAEAEIQER
ncbi:MAG TPA: S41 family peptidase [Thermoanaerobacterales bacterium]|nr:S41 family peptidase [Thermoanaerobacterales bacterium]